MSRRVMRPVSKYNRRYIREGWNSMGLPDDGIVNFELGLGNIPEDVDIDTFAFWLYRIHPIFIVGS